METREPVQVRESMTIDGNELEIITEKVCDGEWALAVENVHGVRTGWCEFFRSAEAALEAGRRAVETEGVEAFISIEGFEYLAGN